LSDGGGAVAEAEAEVVGGVAGKGVDGAVVGFVGVGSVDVVEAEGAVGAYEGGESAEYGAADDAVGEGLVGVSIGSN
jgi:hypothetical protein